MIDALVLCGGHGTRLASVFDGPKFLAPITSSHDRVCDRIIEYLHSWSFIGSIILAAGAQRERIVAANLPVDVVDPISCARGTLDAVARAGLFGDTFLVINGDTLLDLDLAAAYTVHTRAVSEATCIYLRSELDQEVHPAGVRFLSSAARDSLRSSSLTDLDMSLDTIGTLRLYPRGSFLDLGTPEGLALARFPINHRSARQMLCAKALCLLLSSWLTQHGYDGAHRDAVLAYVRRESDFEADVITSSGACLFQWAGERRRKILAHGSCPAWEVQAAFADQELHTLFRGFWSSSDPREHMHRHFGTGALDK